MIWYRGGVLRVAPAIGAGVTAYRSDLATKKSSAPKRNDELDREKGLQMQNAAMATHASKSFRFG